MRAVSIQFLGPVRRPDGVGASTTYPVAPDTTVGDLLESLGYVPGEQARFRVLVDGKTRGLSELVGDAEELTIFLPLGGG